MFNFYAKITYKIYNKMTLLIMLKWPWCLIMFLSSNFYVKNIRIYYVGYYCYLGFVWCRFFIRIVFLHSISKGFLIFDKEIYISPLKAYKLCNTSTYHSSRYVRKCGFIIITCVYCVWTVCRFPLAMTPVVVVIYGAQWRKEALSLTVQYCHRRISRVSRSFS